MAEYDKKVIFHIDMNMFFCSLAVIKYPSLKGKAFACAPSNTTKGVISSASYKAREKGIRSAMSLVEAFRIMPNLICVEPDSKMIHEYHNFFVSLIKEYTKIVEVASVDEVYADMTEIAKKRDKIEIAREIQVRLVKEYHLPCSIGISSTLFLAKMASDLKKPLGLVEIDSTNALSILGPLSVSTIFGIGKKTYPLLIENGIEKISDFFEETKKDLIISLIKEDRYNYVVNAVKGLTSDNVLPNRYEKSESMSRSITFDIYLETIDEVLSELKKLVCDVTYNLNRHKYLAKGVSITLRDANFKTITRSRLIPYSCDVETFFDYASTLVEENFDDKPIRLLGFSLYGLKDKDEDNTPYNLFTYEKFIDKREKLDSTLSKLQKKYGKDVIAKGKNK